MSDFAFELARLLSLEGSDFIQQLKLIASLRDFRLLEGENNIFTVGGEKCGDYNNLLNAAHKAVSHGYRVYILPNPKGVRSQISSSNKRVSTNYMTSKLSVAVHQWAIG